MKPVRAIALALVSLAVAASPLGAAEHSYVGDTIAARLDLMRQVETLTSRAESLSTSASVTAEMTDIGSILATELAAFGLLFPANTNPGGTPLPDGVSTTASAAIWDDFDAFYAKVSEARDFAVALSTASDTATFATAVTSLRQTCTACHGTYVFYDPFAAVQ